MIFKYFICFDTDGDIECLCKDKPHDCNNTCEEYVLKLIHIDRRDISNDIDNFISSVDDLYVHTNKLTSEIKKVKDKLRRSFK